MTAAEIAIAGLAAILILLAAFAVGATYGAAMMKPGDLYPKRGKPIDWQKFVRDLERLREADRG